MKLILSPLYLRFAKILFIGGVIFLSSGIYLNDKFYRDKIYPNTYIDNVNVSGLRIEDAITKLKEKSIVPDHDLILVVDDIKISSTSAELGATINFSEVSTKAFNSTRENSKYKTRLNLLKTLFNKRHFESKITYENDKLKNLINELNKNIEIVGKNPEISLKISGNEDSVVVFKGEPGRTLNIEQTAKQTEEVVNNKFEESLRNGFDNEEVKIDAVVASTSAILSDDQVNNEVERAKVLVGKSITLKSENDNFSLDDTKLIGFLKPINQINQEKISEYIEFLNKEINRSPQDAEFKYDKETLKVESFIPSKNGLELDKVQTENLIINGLVELMIKKDESDPENKSQINIEVPTKKTAPNISLEQTNDLGIKELIGFGESNYDHSIINRVHNVEITANRINLTIVPPKKEFSFNKTIGEVSARTGYRSAYVISGGKTVLGDGGGVCQVSSTLFRAVLNSGLEVTKRLQHSYRVSYYELNSDPGFDATVYAGDIDFKFVNDTDNHVLISTFVDSENRYMNVELYGTSDGRTTEISNYKKWDFRNPPATEYYPTNELAHGQTKQIDWSVSGLKTEFTHTIKDKFGNVMSEDVYYSNYRPWSAKYMVGI